MSLAAETILIVEDDSNDATLLERTFQGLSLASAPQLVPSGEVAIAYLDGQNQFANRDEYPLPSLLFLDLKLPGISGFELLTWLRRQARFARTQVVVLTGSRRSLDVYRAYELGANSYLVKPIQQDDLAGLAQSLKLPWLALTGSHPSGDAPSADAPQLTIE
jgi:CheY-like chemotaxis protein